MERRVAVLAAINSTASLQQQSQHLRVVLVLVRCMNDSIPFHDFGQALATVVTLEPGTDTLTATSTIASVSRKAKKRL